MAAPTIDEIYETVVDYADFEEVGSLSRAKTFITAAKRFLIANPASQGDQGSSISMSVTQIENLLKRAMDYVSATDTSSANSRVTHLHVGRGFR
jgi:hypothetical protein